MILEALWGMVVGLVSGVLSLLPDWRVDISALTGTTRGVGSFAAALNGYFPVATLGICLGILLAVKVGLLGWRVVLFVYSIIPFKAT